MFFSQTPAWSSLSASLATLRLSTAGLAVVLATTFAGSASAQTLTDDINELTAKVAGACPQQWEDLQTEINSEEAGDLWADQADKDAYLVFLAVEPSETAHLSDNATIAGHCTAQRAGLLNAFMGKLPQNVLTAMSDINYEPGETIDGFEVGDIRHTARPTPARGWVFLLGQTIGKAGTGADLEGDEYKELYELATGWAQNGGGQPNINCAETTAEGEGGTTTIVVECSPAAAIDTTNWWDDGQVLKLPDMQGRTIVGRVVAPTTPEEYENPTAAVKNSDAWKVGSEIGAETHTLTTHDMPEHSHTMENAGSHNHNLRVYRGSGGNSLNAIIRADSIGYAFTDTVTHSVTESGSHKHTIRKSGKGEPHSIMQPSMIFNVEMKYTKRK